MLRTLARRIVRRLAPPPVPPAAAAERDRDRAGGVPAADPGPDRAVAEAVGWLGRAQDHSKTADGGAARHYSLLDGWGSSYPETTGYIVPTLLDYAKTATGPAAADARDRARRMLDWLVSIQLPGGGFQGGMVDQTPVVPVTFNTGQILMGLAAGVREWGDPYRAPMTRAADWLADTLDPDGCWRRFPTPFAAAGEKAYETHVAWGLLEADRAVPSEKHRAAALANIRWALTHQKDNGWFDRCDLENPAAPLTHTLGYVLRGVVEGYRTSRDPAILAAARKTADGLLGVLEPDGRLPGRLDARWRGAVSWACLTGIVQIAHSWLLLFEETGDGKYREAAGRANRWVRRTMSVDGPPETRGGVKGSFPVDGDYGRYQYLNWAAKFLIDSHLAERRLAD